MPLDVGRVTHLVVQMHRSEDDAGDPIDIGFLLAADGARGLEWIDPATVGDTTALTAAVFGYQAHGNTGSTETFDASVAGAHSATLNAATVTITLSGATAGQQAWLVLELLQDGTGGRAIDLPASVLNAAALEAGLDTTAGNTTIYLFYSRDGGTNWFGWQASAGGSALTIKDEGTPLATAATSIDFVGAGVVASGAGAAKTVTIAGGATASDTGAWVPVMDGSGNVVTDSGTGAAIVTFVTF